MTLFNSHGGLIAAATRLAAVALVAGVAFAGLGAASAQAATMISFDGDKKADPYLEEMFSVTPARIVNGNCISGGCLALNDNETSTITFTDAPGTFTLNSLNFNLLGNGTTNTLNVSGSNGASTAFSVAQFAKNTYHLVDLGELFAGVTSVTLSTNGGGNVRIDNAMTSPAPVPLPAAAWLLLGGMAGLGAVARKRKAALA